MIVESTKVGSMLAALRAAVAERTCLNRKQDGRSLFSRYVRNYEDLKGPNRGSKNSECLSRL